LLMVWSTRRQAFCFIYRASGEMKHEATHTLVSTDPTNPLDQRVRTWSLYPIRVRRSSLPI